jgi:acyl-CoA reductase-like NAD-dependent aldehyde dehydrogenase
MQALERERAANRERAAERARIYARYVELVQQSSDPVALAVSMYQGLSVEQRGQFPQCIDQIDE